MVCVRACGVHSRGLRGVVGVCEGLCGPVLGLGGKGFGFRRGRWFWVLGWDRLALRSGVEGVSGRGIVSGHTGG